MSTGLNTKTRYKQLPTLIIHSAQKPTKPQLSLDPIFSTQPHMRLSRCLTDLCPPWTGELGRAPELGATVAYSAWAIPSSQMVGTNGFTAISAWADWWRALAWGGGVRALNRVALGPCACAWDRLGPRSDDQPALLTIGGRARPRSLLTANPPTPRAPDSPARSTSLALAERLTLESREGGLARLSEAAEDGLRRGWRRRRDLWRGRGARPDRGGKAAWNTIGCWTVDGRRAKQVISSRDGRGEKQRGPKERRKQQGREKTPTKGREVGAARVAGQGAREQDGGVGWDHDVAVGGPLGFAR